MGRPPVGPMDGQHTRHHGVDGVTAVLIELLAIQIAGPDLELHRGTPDGLLPNGSCVLMMIVGRIHPTGRWQGNVGGSLIDIVGARTADARITITNGRRIIQDVAPEVVARLDQGPVDAPQGEEFNLRGLVIPETDAVYLTLRRISRCPDHQQTRHGWTSLHL